VVGLLLEEVVCKTKHLVKKDGVGLLLGEVVCKSTKKKHILAKDVVGLQVGDNEDSLITSQK
jgi:hypothetical protein